MALLALWNPNLQFLKTDGKINAGGKIIVTYHNDADSIPANYSDADGTTINSSPIVLDALGRATCYIDDGSNYDLYVKDANDATLWTVPEMTPGTETIVVRGGFSVSSNDRSLAVTISVDSDGVTNYDLSIQNEIDRAKEAEKGLDDAIEAEKNRAEEAERTLSKSISEKAGTASPLMDGKASVGNSLKYAREDHVHPSDTSREDKANKTTVVLGTSNIKYPTDKAVAEFVNSSIATNTANYISNNGEPFTSVEQLNAYTGTVTNNDYAFVTGIDSEGNTYYDRYKATVSGENVTWALEYRLNNSSFTAAQWSAINSGITSALVAKIHDHSNKDVLDGITATDVSNWNSKQNSLTAGDNITIDGSTISSDQVFVATYGTTKYAEVNAAYNAGKICMVFKNDLYYYLNLIEKNRIRFISQTPNPAFGLVTVFSDDRWETSNSWLQARLSFDSEPKAGSNNPVTSKGIKTAIDTIDKKGITVKKISGEQVICFE